MANNNRNDIEKLSEGLAIKFLLIKFAEYIKSEFTLCNDYGSMFSHELTESNPKAEDLVNDFLKISIKED